jgi:hypothetical protein
MLIGHKTFYVKGGKLAYCGNDISAYTKVESLNAVFHQYNYWMPTILSSETEYMSYIIFYDDGSFTNGFLPPNVLDKLQVYTEDELIIKDIIQ